MKLGTLKNDTRDGALCVVSRDLKLAQIAHDVAPTLQAALDDWRYVGPQLAQLSDEINTRPSARAFEVDFAKFHSPLPRAYQWADGSAYVNHVELVRKARGAEMPQAFWTDPLMYQGGSDAFLAPHDDVPIESEAWGIDLEGEVAVIVDDVPMGVRAESAGAYIRLVMLANDFTLRNLVADELGKGFGFFQSKPSSAFSPVAITPDELGAAWDGGKVSLPLVVHVNGALLGRPNAGTDMTFEFPRLVAHAARSRPLAAGTIVGSGTISNSDRSAGSACLAERRMLEALESGKAATPFLRFGDRVRIEMLDADGRSLFGAIDQQIVRYVAPR